MANVATCPACKSALRLPEEFPADNDLRCPTCGEVFAFDPAQASPLPLAIAVPRLVAEPDAAVGTPDLAAEGAQEAAVGATEPTADSSLESLLDQLRTELPAASTEQPTPDNKPAASELAPESIASQPAVHEPSPTAAGTIEFAPGFQPSFVRSLTEPASEEAVADTSTTESPQQSADLAALVQDAPRPSDALAKDFSVDLPAPPSPGAEPPPSAMPAEPSLVAEVPSRATGRRTPWLRGAGVVGGVAAGLCLGYGLLLSIGGSRYDSLGLLGEQTTGAAVASTNLSTPEERPERLASFESPSDELPLPADLAVAQEPAALIDPPALEEPRPFPPSEQPQPASAESLIAGAPRYGIVDLENAMIGAEQARADLAAYRLEDQDQLALLGRSYAKLCELAQVLSFLEEDASQPGLEMQRLHATNLFARLFRHAHARADSAQVAMRWLTWGDRTHGGIFFSGIPEAKGPAGSVYEYQFRLANEELVTVLTPEPIEAKRFLSAESIGLVGCVIESPTDRVAGYTGHAEQAVWVLRTIPLGAPDLP